MTVNQLNSIGVGIAFGYYLYLKDAPFEKLNERINIFEAVKEGTIIITSRKVLILVPVLQTTSNAFGLNKIGNVNDVEKDVAGVKGRIYPLTVYGINSKEGEKYFILDTAQCLDVLHRIHVGKKPLTTEEKLLFTQQFLDVLSYLLDSDTSCRNYYKIIPVHLGDNVNDTILRNYESRTLPQKVQPRTLTTSNLGVGLAYWYFFNYLCVIAPELQSSIEKWELNQRCSLVSKKLFILIPSTCFCPPNMQQLNDPDIEYAKDLDSNRQQIVIGTTSGRKYFQAVLKLRDKESNTHFCLAEYAPPIRQIYRMFDECSKKMDSTKDDDMGKHRHDFLIQLRKLLNKTVFDEKRNIRYCDLYETVHLIDHLENFVLSEELLRKIRSSMNRIYPD